MTQTPSDPPDGNAGPSAQKTADMFARRRGLARLADEAVKLALTILGAGWMSFVPGVLEVQGNYTIRHVAAYVLATLLIEVLPSTTGRASYGKHLLGLTMVRSDHSPIGLRHAVKRVALPCLAATAVMVVAHALFAAGSTGEGWRGAPGSPSGGPPNILLLVGSGLVYATGLGASGRGWPDRFADTVVVSVDQI